MIKLLPVQEIICPKMSVVGIRMHPLSMLMLKQNVEILGMDKES